MINHRTLVTAVGISLGVLAGVAACGTGNGTGPAADGGVPDSSDTNSADASVDSSRDAGVDAKADADAPTTFTIGGTISGLEGEGLLLETDGDTVSVAKADKTFSFPKRLATGARFDVTVKAQPSGPAQTCVVTNGEGAVSANVSNVTVACSTNTYPVSVNVVGLEAAGLVLSNNGGDDLPVTAAPPGAVTATFTTEVASGKPFKVAIKSQPTRQACKMSGGEGTVVAGPVTTVTVNCSPGYVVGGNVTGLTGSGLVLQNNLGDDVSVNAVGTFTFPTLLASGDAYDVTVKTQPSSPWQTCLVDKKSGTVTTKDVDSISIHCTTDQKTVGGTISGLSGTGAKIALNDTTTLDLTAGQTSFTFPAIDSGAGYRVSVVKQPTGPLQTCSVTDGMGTVADKNVTSVKLVCETDSFVTHVKVTGLVGSFVLQNNGGDDLTVNASGDYVFTKKVNSGASYLVTFKTPPADELCVLTDATGTVVDADVTATVSCRRNKIVFATSTVYDGNLGGLDGADAKCGDRATAAGLPGTFRAWLSDATGSPATRFNKSTWPYLLIDGTVVADSYAALTSGPLKHAIDLTEVRGVVPTEPWFGRQVVWSTTREDGSVFWDEYSCSHWTSNSDLYSAQVGNPNATDYWSVAWTGQYCSRNAPLYCFEQ